MTLWAQILNTMDRYGVIGQVVRNEDNKKVAVEGGDSMHKMGHYYFMLHANRKACKKTFVVPKNRLNNFEKFLDKAEDQNSFGNYRRHFSDEVSPNKWIEYTDGTYAGNMSRDQTQPMLLGMIASGATGHKFSFVLRYLMRLCLLTQQDIKNHQDPTNEDNKNFIRYADVTGPEFMALVIRMFPVLRVVLWPLLCVLDIETLVSSVFRRFYGNDDVANHCSICINGMIYAPTPTMYVANKINSYSRMKSMHELYWGSWREQSYMVELFDAPMKKYFGR